VADVLAVACSPYAHIGSHGCLESGMDVIDHFGYKPVSTIIITSAKEVVLSSALVISVFVC